MTEKLTTICLQAPLYHNEVQESGLQAQNSYFLEYQLEFFTVNFMTNYQGYRIYNNIKKKVYTPAPMIGAHIDM